MEFIDIAPSIKAIRPIRKALSLEKELTPHGGRLITLLDITAEYLKSLTKSDGYIFYFLNEILGELYISSMDPTDEPSLASIYRWKIENGDTIAVYALKQMSPILVDANTSTDLNYPYLQALPGFNPRYILSVPLMSFQKHCFGVLEYYRDTGGQYTEHDVKLCQFMLQNCAEAFKQNENAVFFSLFNEVEYKLQDVLEMHALADCDEGSYGFIHEVVSLARKFTGAQSSSFYFQKQRDLVKMYSTDTGYCFLQEEDKRIITRSEMSTNFYTTLMNRKIKGIVKVCNKEDFVQFSQLDKQIMEAFSQMCTIWCMIEYTSGNVKRQKSLNDNILNLIHMQLQSADYFGRKLEALVPSELQVLNSWFYSMDSHLEGKNISSDLVQIINCVKGDLSVPEEAVRDFVVMVEQCHRTGEEIDFLHTGLCVQGLYRLLQSCKCVATDHEAFAMIIASLCNIIAINDEPTATSPIFGRYNLYPKELIRFDIVKFLIEESKLLSRCTTDEKDLLLNVIKDFMIDMNINRFKLNTGKLGKFAQNEDSQKLDLQANLPFRSIVQSIMPGLGNILGHFRSKSFRQTFPNFSLFQYLDKTKMNCIDIIFAICPA